MTRQTFVTMSTLAFTIAAYVALTQTAHADAGVAADPRGVYPEAVGTGLQPLPLSSASALPRR
jgi:hypothetical protein